MQFLAHRKHSILITETNELMLFKGATPARSENCIYAKPWWECGVRVRVRDTKILYCLGDFFMALSLYLDDGPS